MRRWKTRGAVAAVAALLFAGTAAPASAALTTLSNGSATPPGAQLVDDPADYVDPLTGTGSGGSTVGEINNFPGPATPFGMMQFSPDTVGSYAGYQYHSDTLRGFSIDHASVGCTAFGDVPILPVTGDIGPAPWNRTEHFSHTDEKAEPGYYAVTLADSKVRAELTASTRTGLAAFTFPKGADAAQVLVKGGASLAGDKRADMHVVGDRQVTGSATTGNFCGKGNEYTVHYAITFDRPFTAHGTWDGKTVSKGSDTVNAPKAGAYLTFGTAGTGTVRAKISMSYVSVDGAEANMASEVPGWSLDKLREQTRDRWTSALRKVRVAGRDTGQLKTFYTSLYHSLMHPNTFNDVDGRYIGFDNKVRELPKGRTQYANFSDWDTCRSLAPLQAMLWPKEASDMAQSLVNDAEQGGWWPRWPFANGYTGQMTGDNSVALIANLYAYGARDFDLKTALKYLVKGATTVDSTPGAYHERPDIANYVERGYAPNNDASRGDHQRVGGSVTLEWAIDDFSIAQLATAAGDRKTARTFTLRSQNWQNILNPATGYLQPRGEDGRFPDGPGFQPPPAGKFGQDGFDEGNAAQYNWLVPQNTAGLITAMGGRETASQRLDTFFTKLNAGPNEPYMWAGNEIDFGVPWVYDYLGQPWKTQKAVRDVATTLFSPTPDGEPGNDDLGAQSSWYVWAALGVYPSTPGTSDLAVHSPLFERAVLDLPGKGDLDIRAPKASASTPYVHDLKLDGRDWERTYLPKSAVSRGGRLDFTLSGTPDTHWATSAAAAPPSYRTGERSFLANATPNQVTSAPGGDGAEVTVDAQRLAGHDHSLTVTASPPKGLTVSATTEQLKLDQATGSGSVGLTVEAGPKTPDGYYEVPLTVGGSGKGNTVRLSAIVLVAADGSPAAAYDNTGLSDDADHGQADFDGAGNSYSRQALAAGGLKSGARVEASGTSFVWPAAPQGRPDNVVADGRTLDLSGSAKDAKRLLFVGSATNGDHQDSAKVTFTDGSTGTADLSFGDWTLPGGGTDPVLGNTLVAHSAYRNQPGGTGGAADVFATAPFKVPDGKQIKSVTLPKNPQLHVFAVGLG
ncbi:GH92 family glycosyl hydrolase [Streptomyces sp. NBC_01197]|uniref:GH92 family glycosyl hydrolase n=1 Tax=Streptomyces sp. NBC_01197 TaxID=2903768 RepID=UPI002E14EB78|nr:GH92 family glycosyl hydrolase [Streptomyces sp. NBC_01197]